MATYEAYARSNYFAVKDVTHFTTFCERWYLTPTSDDANASRAINNRGETVRLSLDDIFPLAKPLGEHITDCSY